MATKLTQKRIEAIQPTGKRFALFDTCEKGLNLVVGATGYKVWYFDYRNRDGKKRRFKIGPIDRFKLTAARAEARKLAGSIADGEDPAGERVRKKTEQRLTASRTLTTFLEGEYWEKTLSHAPSGEATRARIRAAWEPFLVEDLAAFTVKWMDAYRAKRLKRGIKPSTLNRDRRALNALLNRAVEWGVIETNPLKLWKPLKLAEERRVRYLGQRNEQEDIRDDAGNKIGERDRFLKALAQQPEYIQTIVTIALNTGMRRGEILYLRWTDIGLQRREILLRAETTKTRRQRHVPLNQAAAEALEIWKKTLKEKQKNQGAVINIQGYVFPGPTGGPMFSIKHAWATLCRDAQVTDFRLHDCRHDFCSRLVMAGVDLYTVRDLAGHSSIQLTERYAHLAPEKTRAAVEVLDG